MMKMKKLIWCLAAVLCAGSAFAVEYVVTSPDKKITVTVATGPQLTWSIGYGNETVLNPSKLSLALKGFNGVLGGNASPRKVVRREVDNTVEAVVPTKNRIIRDRYNEMKLSFRGGYAVTFRVYDNGAAYRFETSLKNPVFVEDETVEFNFPQECTAYWPRESNPDFITHCEGFFDKVGIGSIPDTKYGYLPIYLSTPAGTKMVVMDADLFDYPNLFLFGTGGNGLKGGFPKVILESRLRDGADRDEVIVANADYIAATEGTRTYPWRLLIINEDDRALLENNLVYQLSTPAVEGDKSWIRPGKISWEWWNSLNVYGVDFEAGVNTDTYKYFIDFAAHYGLEYILLDEGWSASTSNIKEPRPELDIAELVRYGESKGVGLVLWALWNPMYGDIDNVLDVYRDWGVKGIKVDFMQRSDQGMVNYYEDVARSAFERGLLVDFHGSYKPSGIHRKYPNVMTFEGVYGMEHNKSSHDISPDHDLILPFTRMVAGPMDYTPGATVNAARGDFHMSWEHPMSQGTRAHQAAIFVAFESPLQMLCDSPTHYYREDEYTRFIADVPTVWDETVALAAEAGEYLAIARRSGDTWYVAGLTNWTGRELGLKLDFLGEGTYDAVIFRDGVNANRYGSDYRLETAVFEAGQPLTIKMADGGGWAAKLTPVK